MEHHPVATNSLLTLSLWVLGDGLAQYSEHRMEHPTTNVSVQPQLHDKDDDKTTTSTKHDKDTPTNNNNNHAMEYNYLRTLQCASYGALVTGPLLALWYPFLDRVCLKYNVAARLGHSLWAVPVVKVAADEFLMDPPCLAAFFGYMNVCEGGSWQRYQDKLRSEFWTSWATSLVAWPPLLLGAFRFLPVYGQAPFINVCCILWDGFLSHRNRLSNTHHPSSATTSAAAGAAASATATTEDTSNNDTSSHNKQASVTESLKTS